MLTRSLQLFLAVLTVGLLSSLALPHLYKKLSKDVRERGILFGLRAGEKMTQAASEISGTPKNARPLAREKSLATAACWIVEGFRSATEWQNKKRDWNRARPKLPRPLLAMQGLETSSRERDFAILHFDSDKKMHCYLGCRIAQETDFATAQFAAWEKERRDLDDCRSDSHFETLDYDFTLWGAYWGVSATSPSECESACDQLF